VKHPQLGSGLLVTLQIPYDAEFEEIAKEAALLNFLEASHWMDFPQLGCWQAHQAGTDPKCRLAHASFIPNALYAGGLATNFAFWSMARVRWFRQERQPQLVDRPMSEILQKRLGSAAQKNGER
jgi:hypothetical protein